MQTPQPHIRAAAVSLGLLIALAGPVPARAGGVYFVKDGDTLTDISRIFQVQVSRLLETNGLTQEEGIHLGDRLRIPDPPRETVTRRTSLAASREAPGQDRVRELICREEKVFHEVVKGDTLAALSRRYRTPLDELLRLNALRRTSKLSIGQKILVRRSGPRTHVVRRGETLHRIARRYRIGVEDLRRLNEDLGDRLVVGQRLIIEPCDQFAVAGTLPKAPPVSGTAAARESAPPQDDGTADAPAANDQKSEGVLEPTAASLPAGGQVGGDVITNRVINLAKTMLDIPYRFGGTTLRGIDCSAYVQRVFGLIDVDLPRTAREQFGVGERISRDELSVGDLVFFRTYARFPSHVGIYLGDNLFIHASSVVRKVTIDSLDRPYYTKRFLGGRRLVGEELAATQIAEPPK